MIQMRTTPESNERYTPNYAVQIPATPCGGMVSFRYGQQQVRAGFEGAQL